MLDTEYQKGKYFMYLRKSTESEEKQVASIGDQKSDLEEIIQREKLQIVQIFEESKSAHDPGRPIFNEMMDRIKNGEANGIIAWHLNRLSRNPVDGGLIIYFLDKRLIKFIRVKDRVILNTSTDKFMVSIELGISKKYSDDLSDVVKRANRVKFNDRYEWAGRPKPGYLNSFDPVTKLRPTVIDPDRFHILKDSMKKIIYDNYTTLEALHWLNDDMKYKTRMTTSDGGKPLQKSAFYRILKDTYYYGLITRNEDGEKKEIMGRHLPMITKEEYDALQERLKRKDKPKIIKHEFAYRGIMRCGDCGASIIAQEKYQIICPVCKLKFHRGKKTVYCPKCKTNISEMTNPKILHYVYYGCSKRKNPKCPEKHIQISNLEQQIEEMLAKYEIPEDFCKWALRYLKVWTKDKTDNQKVIRENLHKRHFELQQRLDNLVLAYTSPENKNHDIMPKEQFERIKLPLTDERDTLLGQLESSDRYQDEVIELTEKTFNFSCYARYWFATGDLRTKTQILATLGNNLIIRDKKLLLEPSTPFVILERSKKDVAEITKCYNLDKEIIPTIQTNLPDALKYKMLGDLDSNQDTILQRDVYYHCTISQNI